MKVRLNFLHSIPLLDAAPLNRIAAGLRAVAFNSIKSEKAEGVGLPLC